MEVLPRVEPRSYGGRAMSKKMRLAEAESYRLALHGAGQVPETVEDPIEEFADCTDVTVRTAQS